MSFEIGDIIGDYEIIDLLGRGGMGSVFRVRNVISHRAEAMKILLPDLRDAPDLADRFAREIRVQASLIHPNIAALHTAVKIDNQLVMLMELVEGASLEEKLCLGEISMWDGVECINQVLAALSYAHQRGVVHRDIKPANIMITPEGVTKLMDFGIASTRDPGRKLTAAGTRIGSLYYMSPELVRTDAPDGRSDIYAVGVTLYEIITGQRPISGSSDFAIMRAHLEVRPIPPMEVNDRIPKGLSDIVMRSLEKNPDERFQTADEFLSALQGRPASSHASASAHPSTAPPQNRTVIASSPVSPVPSTPRPFSTTVQPVPVAPRPLSPSPLSPPPTGTNWDPTVLEKVKKQLGLYVGPMARVLVNRAAKNTQSLDQLYEILSAEIASPEDRQKFLSSRPR